MRIECKFADGIVTIAAVDPMLGAVALVEGANLGEVTKKLVSRFAELQKDTIEALRAAGFIHYVPPESLS